MNNHEVDYKLMGEEMQCVEVELDPQEAVIAEPGSFMMMTEGIEMQTLFGDGNEKGIMGKLFSAGKRLLTGENLFMTVYTNTSNQKRQVSFAAPYAGKIIPLNLQALGNKVICQKDSFLCAAKGVAVGIEFQKKLGTGLF
ncbi:MAG TPA: AIM24 family protein, partial [Bacteroidia bacterium]|nr:AIM24 family protein [Bacteroidia bacterium]